MRDGDRVFDPATGLTRVYWSMEWHQKAWSGADYHGCRLRATIDGQRLRVQHGENPEHVRWFSLDELNLVGRPLDGPGPVWGWVDQVHAETEDAPAGAV